MIRMNPKQYILNELEFFIKEYPAARVRYEYDKNADIHFIEITPNEIYHFNETYIAWEREMDTKFTASFPIQNICFISDDALVGIECAEYTLYGSEYTSVPSYSEKTNLPKQQSNRISAKTHAFISIN